MINIFRTREAWNFITLYTLYCYLGILYTYYYSLFRKVPKQGAKLDRNKVFVGQSYKGSTLGSMGEVGGGEEIQKRGSD